MSAPLVIRTGLPGNGKTLNTIKEVDTQAKAEGRPVYFHNVAGLKPEKLQADWFEFDDPLRWHELPKDAIIVVDEAQGSEERPMFGVRDPRKPVPPHITAIETIRHRGHQLHLITQDPRFLDVHARRLCNEHIHYWRIFGSPKVSRYVTPRVVNDVEKLSSFSQSSRTIISLDKSMYGVYTSSQGEHHFRFKPPVKVIASVGVIIIAVVGVFSLVNKFSSLGEQDQKPGKDIAEQVKDTARGMLPSIVPSSAGAPGTPITKSQYVEARMPRIEQLPASAPVYDTLTQPKAYPKLYCLSSTDERSYARNFGTMATAVVNGVETVCQCYTQQGTRVETEFAFCAGVVNRGYFDPAIPDRSVDQRMMPTPSGPGYVQDVSRVQPQLTVVGSGKPGHLW